MTVTMKVKDVNGSAIDTPSVSGTYQGPSGSGTISGIVFNVPDECQVIVLHVAQVDYVAEDVTALAPTGNQPWRWNNPICGVSSDGSTVEIVVVLSRIHLAPVFYIPEDGLATYQGTPPGVLLSDTGGGKLRYRNLFDGPYRFRALDHPLLARNDSTPWQRFRYLLEEINPAKLGHFFLLEYGNTNGSASDRARFLIGVYFPVRTGPGTLNAVDFIWFYSPTTAQRKFLDASYPFGITKDPQDGKKHQPYPELAMAYFFNVHWLVYEILAVPRACALVLPISPAGQWGPLASRAGVHRLLKEVAHYLCRNNETTQYASLNDANGFSLTDGRLARTARDHFATYGAIPSVGKVAITDFSQGSQQTSALFVTANIPSEQSGRFTANFFAADPSSFLSSWTEVWDLDGAHGYLRDREEFKKRLLEWYCADGQRQFRLYYSEYTGATLNDDDTGPLSSLIKGGNVPHWAEGTNNNVWAREIHAKDSRWSNVMFSNAYLMARPEPDPQSSNDLPIRPQFHEDDPNDPGKWAHQFVPNVAFGHAARISKLA